MILVSLSEIAVIAFVNRYGSDATAAWRCEPSCKLCANASRSWYYSLHFAAQSIGANQFDRLQKVVKAGIIMNYVIGGVLISLIYLFSRDILSLFLTSQTTIEIAHSLL